MKVSGKIFLSILVLTGFSALRCGATVYQSDGSAGSVQGLHNAVLNGDTITLPAGTFIWNTQIRITKNITLAGAGPGVTIIYDNVSKSGDGDRMIPMFFTGITGNLRVTGFTVRGMAPNPGNYNQGTIAVTGTSHSVRIDHVNIERPDTGAFVLRGVWGVCDHCYVDGSNFKQGWQIFGNSPGDESWEAPTNLGSGEGFYIEDCTFKGNGIGGAGATDATFGGRLVFRHNTVINSDAGTHGTEGTRNRGVRSFEYYQNTFACSFALLSRAILLRGGTGVIWGNIFRGAGGTSLTGYTSVISTDNYRSWNSWQPWGLCNGRGAWDANTDGYGYPAIDQVGRGAALDRIRGSSPINQRTGTAAWPRNQSEPVYVWSNSWTRVYNNPGVLIANNQPVVRTGRDIIDNGNTPKPGYTPYVYPHPLISGAARAMVADFNGDGSPDFVLGNASTHQTAIWYLNNNVFAGGAYGPTLPPGWGLASMADFNRHTHPDYALFNPVTDRTAIWYLSGPTFIGGAYGPTLPRGWEVVAAADFDGDGNPDYVLYNASSRQTAIWYLNNNVFVGGAYGPTLPPAWSLFGVADFDHDGHPDYALFNSTSRQTAIWYLSGPTFIGGAYGPTLPSGWASVATKDFNGNGKPDYLLYNAATRQTAIWYLNNKVFVSGAFGPTLPAGWSLVAP